LLASEEVKERKKRKGRRLREKQPLMMALLPIEFYFFVFCFNVHSTLYTRLIVKLFAQRRVFLRQHFYENFLFLRGPIVNFSRTRFICQCNGQNQQIRYQNPICLMQFFIFFGTKLNAIFIPSNLVFSLF